jgi:GTPase SAR1 family protein
LDIIDTAGMEEFSAMRDQWTREARAFALCTRYNVEDLARWVELVERVHDRDIDSLPCVFVLTMVDRKPDPSLDLDEMKTYAQEKGNLILI